MHFDRILVAVDFEALSAPVLRLASCLAAPSGKLHVVHVVDASLLALGHMNPTAAAILEARERLATTARALLDRTLAEAGVTPSERLSCEVAFGRPGDVIVEQATTFMADVVVTGAHGKVEGLLQRALVGSVAEDVSRRSPAPVLVVRAPGESGAPIDRVLVAIDPTDAAPSAEVLIAARDLGQRLGAALEVVSVVSPPAVVGSIYGDVSPGLDRSLLGEVLLASKATLAGFVTSVLGHAAVKTSVFPGSPAREIVRLATPRDVIVCGTHAWGVLGRLAFGSVSSRILRDTSSTVLVVGPGAQAGALRDVA